MGEIVLDPYIGGGTPVKKNSKLVTILFVLLCGVLLGWFIIIALSRGDVPAVELPTSQQVYDFITKPSGEPVINSDVSSDDAYEIVTKSNPNFVESNPEISSEEAYRMMTEPSGETLLDTKKEIGQGDN